MSYVPPTPFPPQLFPQQAPPRPPTQAMYRQPPWSASAIAAFACSLLGCLGITAVLGLLLGVIGIFATRGGRRRGLGFAIAALPISVLTGALFVFAAGFVFVFTRFAYEQARTLNPLLKNDVTLEQVSRALDEVTTPGFRLAVSPETFAAWIAGVKVKHGTLKELTGNKAELMDDTRDGKIVINFVGKFVNGTVPVQLTLQPSGLWSVRLDDIAIDGVSPRSAPPPVPSPPSSPSTQQPPERAEKKVDDNG